MKDQEQSAGSESILLQAAGDIIVGGLSAADVVQITRNEVARAVDELSLTAQAVADARVKELGDRILERFAQSPTLMGAFADPDFQYSLRDAGRAAASNEDPHTEELLVDLLANRAEAGNTSRARLATSQAIKAADKLSLEGLNGLTALWALSRLSPMNDVSAATYLASVSAVAQPVVGLPLPGDALWLQETDALSLTRTYMENITTRKTYRQYAQERAAKYLSAGIPAERYGELQGDPALPDLTGKVVAHDLKPGFVRLHGATREEFLEGFPAEFVVSPPLDELITTNGFGSQDDIAVARWNELIEADPAVSAVADWWDATPWADVTIVGHVVGFVNARRHIAFTGATSVSELLTIK